MRARTLLHLPSLVAVALFAGASAVPTARGEERLVSVATDGADGGDRLSAFPCPLAVLTVPLDSGLAPVPFWSDCDGSGEVFGVPCAVLGVSEPLHHMPSLMLSAVQALKVLNGVVAPVAILVMNRMAFRNGAVVIRPDSAVKKSLRCILPA